MLQASQALSNRTILRHPCNTANRHLESPASTVTRRQRQRLSELGDPLLKPARRCLHVLKAGGPSGGLQKTKRVGGGQVGTMTFMDTAVAQPSDCLHNVHDHRPEARSYALSKESMVKGPFEVLPSCR